MFKKGFKIGLLMCLVGFLFCISFLFDKKHELELNEDDSIELTTIDPSKVKPERLERNYENIHIHLTLGDSLLVIKK